MNGALQFLKTIGPARLGAMAVVAALLIGFFAFIIIRMNTPQMAPLYTDLTFEDSSAIINQLESLGVPYEARSDGSAVLVPRQDVLRVRMRLAEQGLPTGGSVGYEIFDKTDTLGSTSFVQSINHTRALEGELARTIRALDRVVAARVHLVLPERELFRRDRAEPTASIVVKVRGTLDGNHIRAVQHLVASAVEGLEPGNVSIVDETGRLLASGVGEDVDGLLSGSLAERTTDYERRMRREIEEIVSSVVGPGRARVQVSAELDFNRITETSEVFDPDGQVVRSTQVREENSAVESGEDQVTAGNQVPNGGADDQNAGPKERSAVSDETINYEISRKQTTKVVEAGGIKRLSVAVLVDGVYSTTPEGELTYAPRSEEDLGRIGALVRSAVGFDEARGDQIEIVNLRFAEAPNQLPLEEAGSGLFDFTKDDLFYFAELGVTLLLGLMVLLFAIRPLVKGILAPPKEAEAEGVQGQLTGPDSTAMTVDENGNPVALPATRDEESPEDWISVAQAEGALHANTIERVGDLIENYPNEAVAIVRNWLNQAPA